MIELRQASLVYKDQGKDLYACRHINLTVRPGEFLGILGPSGSGKSSLLYMMSGLKSPTSGEVLYKDQRISEMSEPERARLRLVDFGIVFQYPYLIGYLSALENVLVGSPGVGTREKAQELLLDLGIGHKSHRLPHELSGGERQRVCVARALLGGRSVIFADEPTASLDHTNGLAVVDLLVRHRGEGALVIVTHDPSMLTHANRVIHISDGEVVNEEMSSQIAPTGLHRETIGP